MHTPSSHTPSLSTNPPPPLPRLNWYQAAQEKPDGRCGRWGGRTGARAPLPRATGGRGGTPCLPEGGAWTPPQAGCGCRKMPAEEEGKTGLCGEPKPTFKEIFVFRTTSYTQLDVTEKDRPPSQGPSPIPAGLRTQEGTCVRGGVALHSQGEEGDSDGTRSSSVLHQPQGPTSSWRPGQGSHPSHPATPCSPVAGGRGGRDPPVDQPPLLQHKSRSEAPSTCQIKKTKWNQTQTQIKERRTRREGHAGPSRSLASRRYILV